MLQVNQVGLQQGRFSLLADISFEVNAGDRILLTGLPGSGKTQLFRLLNGLARPTQGQICFQGQDIATYNPSELRRKVAWVADPPRLLGMSVREAIAYPLQLQSISQSQIQARLTDACEQFSLPENLLETKESSLSLDQQWCVALIRAWVMQPLLLLLEWPTEESPMLQQAVMPMHQQIQAQGGAMIISSNRRGEQWNWGKQQDWTQIFYLGRSREANGLGAKLQCHHLQENPQAWQQVSAQQEQDAALLASQSQDEDWPE